MNCQTELVLQFPSFFPAEADSGIRIHWLGQTGTFSGRFVATIDSGVSAGVCSCQQRNHSE
jgi:hypothetical protein